MHAHPPPRYSIAACSARSLAATSAAPGRAPGPGAHISLSRASNAEGSSGGAAATAAAAVMPPSAFEAQATEAAAEVGRRPLCMYRLGGVMGCRCGKTDRPQASHSSPMAPRAHLAQTASCSSRRERRSPV